MTKRTTRADVNRLLASLYPEERTYTKANHGKFTAYCSTAGRLAPAFLDVKVGEGATWQAVKDQIEADYAIGQSIYGR